ncbi:MAG TPA: hypothetical protein VHO48_09215 [Anaerolineaceae bacterium]|nr:hypothetical protein [Anaerolineaceae bacterium]
MAGPTAHSPSLASAQANPAGVFQFPGARVSLLTPRLARIELSPTGQFEDRPSQAFWFRDQPVPAHAARSSGQRLTLETEFFRLVFSADAAENASAGPQILLKDSGARIHLDDPNPGRGWPAGSVPRGGGCLRPGAGSAR